ncbi:regulatory signaling modulator protein AmpE [Shigella flexneri]
MRCYGITFAFIVPVILADCGGTRGTGDADGYEFLRAWQSWLARYQTPHHRLQSGIDAILHVRGLSPGSSCGCGLMPEWSW